MDICNKNNSTQFSNPITQIADMPYPLYLSLQGKYFVGYADNMEFGDDTTAWAGLINPYNSGVNMHVYVWTVTNIGQSLLLAQFWFNSHAPGYPIKSELLTPANTALTPLPKPRIKLLQANDVTGEFIGGDRVYTNKVVPEVTVASDVQGTYIFPPGGSFIVALSNSEASAELGQGRVAFGWSEEPI